MTRTRCILTIAMLAIAIASVAEAQHYYSGGETIPLAVDSSYVTIRY